MKKTKEIEESILKFWEDNKTYKKVRKKFLKGKKFYFMDGPPYATGNIHIGTALNKILKDIAMRSKRMQGYNVFDRPGYDTHGVPIELQVEKEIGSKEKHDIEVYGVDKFIEKCREYATKYIEVMNKEFINLGVWMDFNNSYLTLNEDYIEAIWHAFKEADKKGLLYLGKYPVHVCTRCETAVAYNEIEYGKQKDLSIFVKFPLEDKKNTFLIIWTTTPWTLPGNTGIMIHPDFLYQEIEFSNGEKWIIAKELVGKLMSLFKLGFTLKKEFKGKEIKDWKYINPLAKHLKVSVENSYKVVLSSRYVSLDEGTGLVHCAPGHGKEDYEVGIENGLDIISPVYSNGLFTKDAGKYSGKKARIVANEIIEDLEKDGFLVHKFEYDHDYPLCWRDKTPLLMISQPQWFLKISKIHKKILKHNKNVNWIPSYMKLRMKAWLDGIIDWPVSRQRYWGTPLPIWIAEDGDKITIGSLDELRKLSGVKKIDVHKPGIDLIIIKKKGKVFKRIPEVLDVWFDSGVSSWAALGFPKNKTAYKRIWPADLNIEGKDQFRGWWNSQLILSEITFGKKPFNNVMVHGLVLDLGKRKMSKSLGNVIQPNEIIEKYGRDYLRYYFSKVSRGEDIGFDEKEFKEIDKLMRVFININNFIDQINSTIQKIRIEDRWILSKYNNLIKEVTDSYNKFKFYEVIQKLEHFILFDLSRTYIQIIRDREGETYILLNEIRIGLLKLLSPIIPFITEEIWQELLKNKFVNEESIHLSVFPGFVNNKIKKKLEKDFEELLRVIEKGLSVRDEIKIGLKWPLSLVDITTNYKFSKEMTEIIKNQLNVKKVSFEYVENLNTPSIRFDTKITPELEAEGFAREISRKVQSARKKAGFVKTDKIKLGIFLDNNLLQLIESHKNFIRERTNSKEILISDIIKVNEIDYKEKFEEQIKDKTIRILFSKI